jgi:conjugal transfer pilus assembly protein TraU
MPTPGIKMAMWQPTHMVEAVRLPFCSPALGGMLSGAAAGGVFGMAKLGGMEDASASNRDSQSSYLNFHYWKFPLSVITDMVTDAVCVAETASVDIDIAYISEIDPTWNNETLAMFTHPEAVLFANPVATAACMADAVASTAYKPIPGMFWCNGAHGHGYPFSGINRHEGGIDSSSSAAARALAAMHRRGLAKKTYGGACGVHGSPLSHAAKAAVPVAGHVPDSRGDR